MEKEIEKEEGEKPKSSPLKLILILAGVLLLGAGGVIAWLLVGSGPESEVAGPADAPGDGASQAVSQESMGFMFSMNPFVVNLKDPGGKRYLKTKIELEYTSEATQAELKGRLPQLRDVILLLLSSKAMNEIQGIDGKIELRNEMILRINQVLKTGKIRNLYFTEFVIQ